MPIMADAMPRIKEFLKPATFSKPARALLIRCLAAFLMHDGKMAAARAAGAIRSEPRHRAQISRFLARPYWRTADLLGQLRAPLLGLEAGRDGTFVFIVDQTVCGLQGKSAQNTYNTRNTRRRPARSRRKQKKTAPRSCHCFVMGLLLTPGGCRVPFYRPFYTKPYCKLLGIEHRSQADLAATLIEGLPVPDGADVLVLGDTAFDAGQIRRACARRRFRWIVPMNPNRVLAGPKPRPRVDSRIEALHADRMAAIEVHPCRGMFAAYRRASRCRTGPTTKARTYYVHEERRDVHSVGEVRLFFSTTKPPQPGLPADVQKILMTNDTALAMRQVIEAYQLRWQVELFFKELKSGLGLHRYRVRRFEQVDAWVQLCLASFLYLEWLRAMKLRQRRLRPEDRSWWWRERTHGIALAVRQSVEARELDLLARDLSSDRGRKRLARLLKVSHPKEYRAAI